MAGHSETTPFLADSGHDDNYDGEESHPISTTNPSSYFRRPIKLLTSIITFHCLAIIGVLIASAILIRAGDFQYTYSSKASIRDLAICLFVNSLLSAPTLFLDIPIIINMAVNIAMSIVIIVFSAKMLDDGWPDESFCRSWRREPPYGPLPEKPECIEARKPIRIMMGVSAAAGLITGILILTVLLLRLVAISKSKFWEGNKFSMPRWNPTGFTVQITLSVIPRETRDSEDNKKKPTPVGASASREDDRLIEA
ncbi:hypothetical protein F5884DRAFT_856209 [Xylogone sp. PMI_703]|nr:hypothetical protein F5884DRAFT_856209 [Xylogone sp. PMI_703]